MCRFRGRGNTPPPTSVDPCSQSLAQEALLGARSPSKQTRRVQALLFSRRQWHTVDLRAKAMMTTRVLRLVWGPLLMCVLFALGVTAFVHDARHDAAFDVGSDPRPYWPEAFTISFEEKTSIPYLSGTTTGVYYYDSVHNAERVDRAEGHGDRYCGSVHPFKFHTPCTHLAVNQNRYLIFPELKTCCRCCSFSAGCGPLTPSWLDNATYIPPTAGGDSSVNCFSIEGLQSNTFCQYSDSHAPLRISQGQVDDTRYNVSTFVEGTPDPSVFDILPSTCTTKCGGICRFL